MVGIVYLFPNFCDVFIYRLESSTGVWRFGEDIYPHPMRNAFLSTAFASFLSI